MNIGILQCGHVREQFVAEHGKYPAMFSALLKQADPTLTFTLYDTENNEFPSNIDACDAYLITGSRHCVNDDFSWINDLEHFVRQLHQAQKKVIGICFGHQLIAKALGGKVIKSPNGWGIGMSKNKIMQKKPWMNPAPEQFTLPMSHQDQVVELPPEAEVIASNDFCPFYMMQIGNNLTVQGHPEFSKAYAQALIEFRKDILDTQRYEKGIASLQWDKDDAVFAKWIVNFLAGV
jgi:GMP synthase-like glutamine amidotransferase